MAITTAEFAQMVKRNPRLTVRTTPNATPISAVQYLDELSSSGKKRINKYRNEKVFRYESGRTSTDKRLLGEGLIIETFDSVKEFERWEELKLMERAGLITKLERQKSLTVHEKYVDDTGKTTRAITYKADACYRRRDGIDVIEDTKPFDKRTQKYRLTKDFSIKWKILRQKYPSISFEIY